MSSEMPLLENKHYDAPAVFNPESLLRETRRQKSLPNGSVPKVCVLDPDGDIVAYLLRTGQAKRSASWACYHTVLYEFEQNGQMIGVIGCAVGGSFAVLLAEQLFVSGCQLLMSITSAGQILPVRTPPYFVLIDKALRDEGTSYHYLPAAQFSVLNSEVCEQIETALKGFMPTVTRGASWTTDAPYRETNTAIESAMTAGILAVEMEAASLYAFAQAKQRAVVCFAHITNRMGAIEGDFEKGEADGSLVSLELIQRVVDRWRRR